MTVLAKASSNLTDRLITAASNLSHLYFVGMDSTENTVHHCCSSVVAMGTFLFAKPLLSDVCCIFAYLTVIAQQWVYMPQYILLLSIFFEFHSS
jgi:hypothetical protein